MEIETLAIKLQEVADRSVRNEGRIKKLESESQTLHELVTSVRVMAEQMKNVNTNVQKLTNEVEDIKEKPAKRWDSLVNNIIWGVAGALLAFVFAQIGL